MLRSMGWLLAIMLAGPASGQIKVPGDPFAGDPTGIIADPCPRHDGAEREGTDPGVLMLHGYTRDYGGLCVYRADNARLIAAGARPDVVFMGDSITFGWKEKHPAFFPEGKAIDRGIGGQTVPQMLVRFHDDVVALHPRVVHIMAATNDVAGNTGASTLDTVAGQIESMAALAHANGIRVVIASVPPAAAFGWRPEVKPAATIAALNERLRRYAAAHGFVWVDYHRVLATPDGAMKPEFSADGVHPNAQGYAAMEPLARAAIAQGATR